MVCIAAILINLSTEPWNDLDSRAIRAAKTGCQKQYKACLVKFIKKEPKLYHAVCGNSPK